METFSGNTKNVKLNTLLTSGCVIVTKHWTPARYITLLWPLEGHCVVLWAEWSAFLLCCVCLQCIFVKLITHYCFIHILFCCSSLSSEKYQNNSPPLQWDRYCWNSNFKLRTETCYLCLLHQSCESQQYINVNQTRYSTAADLKRFRCGSKGGARDLGRVAHASSSEICGNLLHVNGVNKISTALQQGGSCPTLPPCRSTPGTAGMLSPESLIFAQYNSQTLVVQTPTPKLQFVLLQFIKHYCKIVLQFVDDFCRLTKLYLRLLLRNSASLIVHCLSLNTWYVLLWIKCESGFFFLFFCTTP